MKKLSLRHFFTLPLVSTCFGLVMVACGPTGTTTSSASSGSSSSSGAPEDKYTLTNVCEKTAPLNCAVREGCCTMADSGYVESGCLTDVQTECEKNVADVNAGIMTFDGDAIDTCLAALQPFADKCFLEIGDLFKLPTDLAPCTQIFAGQLKPGDTCDRTAQCASSLMDREIVQCDDATKKCTSTKFLPEGSACKISQTATEFCDQGLYCDFEILTMKGTCKVSTPPGSACSPGTLSFECGLGYKCDSTTKVCVEAGSEGDACQTPLDCKSAKCTSNLCAKADPMFNKMQCTGMP